MNPKEALTIARDLLGPNAFAVFNPSLSRPYRIGREAWLFESTIGTGSSWEEAFAEVKKFLYGPWADYRNGKVGHNG